MDYGKHNMFSNTKSGAGIELDSERGGYDANPDSKLAFLDHAFKSSSSQNKRNVFNEAFRTARRAGLKEFTLDGKRYTTKLKEEVEAEHAKKVAVSLVAEKIKNEGVVHGDKTKAQFDIETLMRDTIEGQPFDFKQAVMQNAERGNVIPIPQATLNYALPVIQKNEQTGGYAIGDVIQGFMGKKQFNY